MISSVGVRALFLMKPVPICLGVGATKYGFGFPLEDFGRGGRLLGGGDINPKDVSVFGFVVLTPLAPLLSRLNAELVDGTAYETMAKFYDINILPNP